MSSSSSDFSENNSQEFEKEDLEEDDEFQPKIFRTTLPKPTSNPLGTGFIPKQSTTLDKDFAKFDKGGKLLRMMEKMGYKKGMGIGKQEDGIAVPVEVVVRAAGVGIGFGKAARVPNLYQYTLPIRYLLIKQTKMTRSKNLQICRKTNNQSNNLSKGGRHLPRKGECLRLLMKLFMKRWITTNHPGIKSILLGT